MHGLVVFGNAEDCCLCPQFYRRFKCEGNKATSVHMLFIVFNVTCVMRLCRLHTRTFTKSC